MLEGTHKCRSKPQYVDQIPKHIQGEVGKVIKQIDKRKVGKKLAKRLELKKLYKRGIKQLSGGELQRLAILITICQKAQIFMFDEPTSYLDVKQRLKVSNIIRDLLEEEICQYVVIVEHDLSICDYLSDQICCLYGVQGAYGVITMPMTTKEGINVFLRGYVKTENMKFRDVALTFKVHENIDAVQ